MWTFAWRNLLTRPMRTTLALVGLSIPILGVMGLFSLSGGMRSLVGDTLNRIQGVVVLREGSLSPVFSDLPSDWAGKIRALPGITSVAPELWKVAPAVEGRSLVGGVVKNFLNGKRPEQSAQGLLDQPIIVGQDIPAHKNLKGAIYPRAMLKGPAGGRFLIPEDRGTNHIVVSSKICKDNADPRTKTPKKVGDTLDIGGKPFRIVGLYETGSILLDVMILMDIGTARRLTNVSDDVVSSFYVEGVDGLESDALAEEIETKIEGADARGANEIMANFGDLMNQLDLFLLATVLLALVVGVVGIVNTMLMSTTERFGEFGVLRTLGWSRANVLSLVTIESAYLGMAAGLIGFALSVVFTVVANHFISISGLSLSITPRNAGQGLLLSLAMGTLGGIYPAWRASRLVPMAAIRLGAR